MDREAMSSTSDDTTNATSTTTNTTSTTANTTSTTTNTTSTTTNTTSTINNTITTTTKTTYTTSTTTNTTSTTTNIQQTPDNVAIVPIVVHWAYLPSVILFEMFGRLNVEDRLAASQICIHWRNNYFHPRWFNKVTFPIEPNTQRKCRFLSDTFGSNVSIAYVIIYSDSSGCIKELIYLFRAFSTNNNLKSLYIEPINCRLWKTASHDRASSDDLAEVENKLTEIIPRLNNLHIACVKELRLSGRNILDSINFNCNRLILYDQLHAVKSIVVTDNYVGLFKDSNNYCLFNRHNKKFLSNIVKKVS